MAADLEAEVQAIDKSLLECSAEEIAVVRRRAGPGWERGLGGRGRQRPGEPFPEPGRGRSAGLASSPGGGVPAGGGSEGTPGRQPGPAVASARCCRQRRCCSSRNPWQRSASFSCCAGWRRWLAPWKPSGHGHPLPRAPGHLAPSLTAS